MKQLTQKLKSGLMELLEVPFPVLKDNHIMVRNYFSIISSGTEGKTASDARKGYVAKAKSRQKEVRQVLEMIKTNGFKETYNLVMNKLEAPSPLGYSCAGEVVGVGEGITDIKVGDFVACGGSTAYHADVVVVPRNLFVKVSKKIDLRHAAFTTIGAIAIQGIRQAELQLGSYCVVIGLGIIGQITTQLLEASGVKAIGIDIDKDRVDLAKGAGLKHVFSRNIEGLNSKIEYLTQGIGADAVIITAGASSLDPVNLAGEISRKRAKIVIVGSVPTGFDRDKYYKKELDLRMSASYGPGRYDRSYEEKGLDYPVGYVRFTENRNMQSFIDLLESDRLNINALITHEFVLEHAKDAYDLILNKTEPFVGILLNYTTNANLANDISFKRTKSKPELPNVGIIGAGNFAQNVLLPRMKGLCNFFAITSGRGNDSVYVARKYGFSFAYDSAEKVIERKEINSIFILTRHNSHARLVNMSLKEGKHVFTEKPLAISIEELEEVRLQYESTPGNKLLMVGFNRRFSPFIKEVRKYFLVDNPKAINIRVNAGLLPKDHWVNDPDVGGGRIIGELCHFIDLAVFIAESKTVTVYATEMKDPNDLQNTINVNLKFANGSIATISFFSNGSKKLPKENIEVFGGESTIVIDDFRYMTVYNSRGKARKHTLRRQDKGHAQEMAEFLNAIIKGSFCPIPFEESYHSTFVTFKVIQSLIENRVIAV